MKSLLLVLSLFVAIQGTASAAEDFPGSGSSSKNLEEEFAKGFAADRGMRDEDNRIVEADRLKIGGYIQPEWQAYGFENLPQRDLAANPITMQLYLDAQLKNDMRAFFKGRFIHDPTIDETVANPISGNFDKQNVSVLDELKVSFNTYRKIFWTLGRQKIKWGASKFWNPTDFLNLERRDFLRTEDLRAGVSMLKAHVPWRATNLYLIAVNDRANQTDQNGAAARFEVPFSFGEITASSYSRKGQPTMVGGDLSFAIKDIDIYLEGAQTDRAQNKSASGGLTYEFKYNDEDVIALGYESFWQENGTEDPLTYPVLLASKKFIPFYIGKKYSMGSISLPNPGRWNHTTFMLNLLQNDNDRSSYQRLTWVYDGISDVVWTVAIGNRNGASNSEMKLLGQTQDAYVQMKVLF